MRIKELNSHGVAFQSIVTTLNTCSNCNTVCKPYAVQKSEEQCCINAGETNSGKRQEALLQAGSPN